MDGKSRWADNIMIERWFRSLKTELIYINDYASQKELRSAILDYVGQYNSIRPQQSLGYQTPDQVYGSSFRSFSVIWSSWGGTRHPKGLKEPMRKPPLEVFGFVTPSFHFLILRLSRIFIKFHFSR